MVTLLNALNIVNAWMENFGRGDFTRKEIEDNLLNKEVVMDSFKKKKVSIAEGYRINNDRSCHGYCKVINKPCTCLNELDLAVDLLIVCGVSTKESTKASQLGTIYFNCRYPS